MKTRFLSGFFAVVGGGAAIVGCFQPSSKVSAEAPRVVTTPAPAPVQTPAPTTVSPLAQQQSISSQPSAPAVAELPTTLSPGISEVAKLYQSNVSEDILLAYIKNYGPAFNPTADEILYLNDLGVSDDVMTALIQHKGDPNAPVVAAAPQPEAQPAPSPAPAPAPTQEAVTAPLVPQGSAAAVAVSEPAPVTVNYFYETLSPYGYWVETEYGRCWRPAVVVSNPGWRPYCDRGHWIYTDSGWYWASDYSWGWATFHYGRWCSDVRFGWVWVPDTCWGPSWVSWRYTSDHCGWAPLPPAAHFRAGVGFTFHSANVGISFDFGLSDSCYTFVPSHRFCDPHPYRYCAPRDSVKVIYNRSTVVNNYIINNNTTIINEGIGRQRIEVATKHPVQKVSIHEWPKNSTPISAPDRVHRVGNDLVVYKPHAPNLVKPKFTAATTTPTTPQNSSGSAWGAKPRGNSGNNSGNVANSGNNGNAWGRSSQQSGKNSPGNQSTWGTATSKPVATAPITPSQGQSDNNSSRHQALQPKHGRGNSVVSSPNVTAPQRPAAPAASSQSAPSDNSSRHQALQPKHGRGSSVVSSPSTTIQQAPSTPLAAQPAPLVPQNSGRGNSWGASSHGNSNRPEIPRQSTTAPVVQAPATPAAPSYRSQPSAPQAAPRVSSDAGRGSHGQSWGQGGRSASQASPRSEGSGRLAEKDSGPGNGNGNGFGRGRN